jgi:sn-glycerol 3-phosphate transport system substrate-binding protein
MNTKQAHPIRVLAAGGCMTLAACASGQSILQAGNDGTTTTRAPVTTGGPVAAPTTIWLGEGPPPTTARGVPTTIQIATPASEAARPGGFAGAPGVTIALAGNTDYAACPVDALDDADAPVRIEFWHTMQSAQGEALATLTAEYNASQDRVVVELQNQTGYEELIDKYFQSRPADRPHLVQMPEYMLQSMADANTVVTTTACIQTDGFDESPFLPRAMFAYQTGGVQWAMPFNISSPVLYYNRSMFEEAGLDPDTPPVTLEALREYSQQIVDSGAAAYGIALDSGINSGGGWFLEQWLARAGLPYADNDNGRTARATQVLFDSPEAAEMLAFAQQLVADGLAVYVGEDPQGIDGLLRMADPQQPAAMTIATSGALGGVLDFVEGGAIAGITSEDIGVGPMPGPSDTPSAIIGGAALYVVRDLGDAEAAASWDFIKFVTSAESQSLWAAESGYAPIRDDATEVDPLATRFADDPRFSVAYDQINFAADDFTAVGPVLGPMREIRGVTARMMADIYDGAPVDGALSAAAEQANLLMIDYANRN